MPRSWWVQVWILAVLSVLGTVGCVILAGVLGTVDPGFSGYFVLMAAIFAFWTVFNVRELCIARKM